MRRFSAQKTRVVLFVGLSAALTLLGWTTLRTTAVAGLGNFNNRAVGGIMVDAAGLVRSATLDERGNFLNRLRTEVSEAHGQFGDAAGMRMISLKKLQKAIEKSLQTGEQLPIEMQVLAGLQRIEYVFLYPEENDIVLAGPAEPWVIRDDASVVGKASGRPVLLLSDLLVALQSVEDSRNGGISCSIEPTAEGRQRLTKLLSRVQLLPGQNPAALEPMMQEAFGPQVVKFNNVPTESHYARVLLAADYQMKRISMALDQSPVSGLPSYLELARNENHNANENPRWWMACNYDAVKHDQDRLAWQISGQGVKTLTEQDLVDNGGNSSQSGRTTKSAQRWADLMTEHYDSLSKTTPVFGELRNLMDMSVIATLILHEGLDQRAGCDLSVLMGKTVEIPAAQYEVPKAIAPHCSFIRGRSGWVVTASGGVEIAPFDVVENQVADEGLASTRQEVASKENDSWWWNG